MTRKASSVDPPFPARYLDELEDRLGRSLEGWAEKRPAYVSPSPEGQVEGAWFDVDAVVRVVQQLRAMPHTKGRWRGVAFEPAEWQIVWLLAPVFGWKKPDGLRIVTELWDETARKSGKTTLSSRLGIILLAGDGELGAEVYAAAGSREQAGFIFDPAKVVAEQSPALKKGRGRLEVLTGLIRHPHSGSIFRVLSRASDLAHGANVHGGLIDEIHIHKTRGLIDAIDSGTGARAQPLIIYTTTANDGDDQTIYGELHGRAMKIAKGDIVDATTWVVIYRAESTDDQFSEDTIRKANPNYPISPTKEYIERKIRKAQDTPSWLPTYRRLHLNIPAALDAEAWAGADAWSLEGNVGLVPRDKLKGARVWLGLVASSSTDLTAIAVVAKNPEKKGAVWWAFWQWYLPRESFEGLLTRTENGAEVWNNEHRLILTDGDVTDVAFHADQIRELAKVYDLQELAYDPNGAVGIISPLVNELEDKLIPVYATNPSSSLMDWERLLRSGDFNHGGDPIAQWQVPHLRVKEASTSIVKIDRRKSTENVCGIAAAELALRRALLDVPKKSSQMVVTYR